MMKLPALLTAAIVLPGLVLAACATDNGGAVFGDQFAPPGKKLDAGNDTEPVPGEVPPGDDAGADAQEDAPADVVVPPTCTGTGTVAVLAGGDAALSGAVSVNGAAWTGGALTGGASKSLPALVAFGTGFVGVTRGPLDVLQGVTASNAFTNPAAIGSAKTIASPSLAVIGGTAHVAYLDAANLFFHGTNGGAAWDAATDPVKFGANQSFGPSAPTIAPAGTDLVFAQAGSDEGLYTQTLTASWSAGAPVMGAGTYNLVPPTLASVTGTNDLVMIYAEKTTRYVMWTGRNAGTKTWSAPAQTNMLATTAEQMSLASLGPTTLLLAFRGQDTKGYLSTGTISGGSITWTAPAAVVAGGVVVDSAPAVAKGVCGDDAVVAFASAGAVKVTRLRAGQWSSPEPVTGAAGARVAVATR